MNAANFFYQTNLKGFKLLKAPFQYPYTLKGYVQKKGQLFTVHFCNEKAVKIEHKDFKIGMDFCIRHDKKRLTTNVK